MAEAKPLASLSAGLLARKGAARPAMRRQMQLPGTGGVSGFGAHEDLGWNDMGYDVDPHHNGVADERPVPHGLSPMASLNGEHQTVRQVLDDAADRASIDPILPAGPVAHDAAPPIVHQHFQRLADEIAQAPVVSMPVAKTMVDLSPPVEAPSVEPQPVAAKPTVAKAPARPRARAGTKGAFAFTLRLDPERHLRLRLASATSNRSAQQILITLVDRFLADQPEIDAFAALLPASAR